MWELRKCGVLPQIKVNNCLKHPSWETETCKLSKLLTQDLCFGSLLILITDCGRRAEPCRGRVPACETHLSKFSACTRQQSALQRGVVRPPRHPHAHRLTSSRKHNSLINGCWIAASVPDKKHPIATDLLNGGHWNTPCQNKHLASLTKNMLKQLDLEKDS